ncbi:hypothetical protein [Candidatus Enterococcus mansonii]|uniref:Uncharacterized protein n=1 Tax=Candidatus Enterococcus mansonii TaxID=1834181 RepID=A0ABU8IBJ2_9ENTE
MSHHFPDVSDCLILDFINTKISKNGKITELIESRSDLANWFDHEIKKIVVTLINYHYLNPILKKSMTIQHSSLLESCCMKNYQR